MAEEKRRGSNPNKKPMTFRFTPETVRKLDAAAIQEGMSMTSYVELALKDRFKKDGIK
jgi:predicted HicB family RNase H-like nuclease